jgi:lysophospholipase L1-like esterase
LAAAFPTVFLILALAFAHSAANGQTVRYEFNGGSMAPTLTDIPAGVAASDFSIGTYTIAALSDNGGNGNSLRLSRGDVGTTSSTALAGPVLSFTLTIPAGVTLNLTSLSLDFTSGGLTGAEYLNARVFSDIDGFDNLTADTIGTLGRVANGANSGTMTLSLSAPDSNPTNGANSNNGDFDSLTNRSITFHLPFIRDSQTTATDYLDIDNLTLTSTNGSPGLSTGPLQIMPMGDSITQGAGAGGGYRSPLFASLSAAGFQMEFIGARSDNSTSLLTTNSQTKHEGHGSYSTDLLLGNLDTSTPYGGTNEGGFWITGIPGTRAAAYPDVILLMIGTNDIGMWAHTPAQTIAYYDQLLTKLVTLRPAAHIICASIVPFVLSEFEEAYPDKVGVYTNRELNNVIFNSLLPGLVATHQAAGHRVQFYDMRQKVNPANAATLIGGDGVHPNQAGYNAIASGWFDAMKRLPLIGSWRLLHFNTATGSGHAADLADPDGDGASNLVEFAFGTDPKSADNSPLHGSTVVDSGVSYLGVTFPRRKHADLRYIVGVSSDLDLWSTVTQQCGPPTSLNKDMEQVIFRDRQASSINEKRFIRLKILKPLTVGNPSAITPIHPA